MNEATPETLLAATYVAALTGVKQQFIDAGWSERGAEEMTHAILLKQTQ